MRIAIWWSSCFYHVFYMMAKFYGFTCTFLDSGMPIRILVCLKRLHRISWQDGPTFWQDWQKVCQIPGSCFYQRVLQDSLILPNGLAKLWNVWWDPSPTGQNVFCWCPYVLFMGPALAEGPWEHPWLLLHSCVLIKGHIMGLCLLKGYVDTWLMSTCQNSRSF